MGKRKGGRDGLVGWVAELAELVSAVLREVIDFPLFWVSLKGGKKERRVRDKRKGGGGGRVIFFKIFWGMGGWEKERVLPPPHDFGIFMNSGHFSVAFGYVGEN